MEKRKPSAAEEKETFVCCGQFQEALDPNIKKAYMGYCRGLEWPFTVMVPIGGLGGDCPNPKPRAEAGKDG